MAWAGPGLLAAATGEGLVRFWDLSSAKNYVLTLQSGGLDRTDKSTCVGFDPIRRYDMLSCCVKQQCRLTTSFDPSRCLWAYQVSF